MNVERAGDLYTQGWTLRQIAAVSGAHWSTVSQQIKSAGLSAPNTRSRRHHAGPDGAGRGQSSHRRGMRNLHTNWGVPEFSRPGQSGKTVSLFVILFDQLVGACVCASSQPA